MKQRWYNAKIKRHRRRLDRLIEDGEWSRALTAVIDFAQWADGKITDADVWLEMTVSATRIVAHLDDPAEYRAFLVHFASPFLGDDQRPRRELLGALADIADQVDPTVMMSIGRWLVDARSRWALGPYLVGHFGELAHRQRQLDEPVRRVAEHFELAARRGEQAGEHRWALHARLRHAALLITSGEDRRTGHEILAQLDWSKLLPVEQLWMVVALAASPYWTDRLRSMDILLDLHRAVSAARPRVRRLTSEDLRRGASTVFRLAGLDLPEAEERRLQQLSDTLFGGDERREWDNFLRSRRRLSDVAGLPFDESEKVVGLLEKLQQVDPDRWQPVMERFRILRAGWLGDYHADRSAPSAHGRSRRLPVTDAIARLLDVLAANGGGDDAKQATVEQLEPPLERLLEALEGLQAADDAAAARPVALVWPRLLSVASRLPLPQLEPKLIALARLHTSMGVPPGYGWWTLAAHLYDADLQQVAIIVADCALTAGSEGTDEQLRGYVASRAFRRAVDRQDPAAARRWLDALPD